MFSNYTKNITRDRSIAFWLLAIYLAAIFCFGGSSRDDVESSAILQPLSVFMTALALVTLNKKEVLQNLSTIIACTLIVIVVCIYLIPFPHSYWNDLASHQLIEEVDRQVEIDNVWRALAINHFAGVSTFFSILVPIGVLLLSIQTQKDERFDILAILVFLGILSALIGLFQAIGSPHGPLYFYRITNNGSAVGLFANRNHQALLLAIMFPMIAIFASSTLQTRFNRYRNAIALALATFLVPMILVTGSRAGLALSIPAIVSAMYLYRRSVRGNHAYTAKTSQRLQMVVVTAVTFMLLFATIIASRATALERLLKTGDGPEDRFSTWSYIIDMAWAYFPFGTGPNGFSSGYTAMEHTALLDSTYLNRAHNDWIELFATFGLPALVVVVIAVAALAWKCAGIRNQKYGARDTQFILLGLVILMLVSLSSFVDYASRTPIISSVAMLALSWVFVSNSNRISKTMRKQKTVEVVG